MRCLILILALLSHYARAQNFDQYRTLIPASPIPKDFTEKSFLKVETEVKNTSPKRFASRRDRNDFYLESTFTVDEFLSGGSVLFNDPVSIYLDKVLRQVLASRPDLQGKVRIYAVKSSAVNAFTTNNGIIFVNLGLLARLTSEAQLAFVLAHELVHFEKQHVLDAYIAGMDIDRGSGTYKNISVEDRSFAKSSYSKELETEADAIGADLFLRTPYSADSVDKVFEILKMADLPVIANGFRKDLFEGGKYVLPDSLVKKTVEPYVVEDDYDDIRSSHPNVKKRKTLVQQKFRSRKGGKEFVVSEEAFRNIKKLSQFDVCRTYLLEHQYLRALNLATMLLKEDPKSDYLNHTIAKALYGIAKEKLFNSFEIHHDEWKDQSSRIAYFFRKLGTFETSVLALRMLGKALEQDQNNPELTLMVRDLSFSLGHFKDLSDKFLRPGQAANNALPYTQFAFSDFKHPEAFFAIVDEELKRISKSAIGKKRKYNRAGNTPVVEDIEKIVVVNPRYRKLDKRKKQRTRHIESEKVVIDINEKIHAAAGRLDLQSEILNPNTLTSGEARTMQSNSILGDWLQEQFRAGDRRMISPIHNEVLEVARMHKTDHFLWLGCASVVNPKKAKGLFIASALVLPSIAPASAAYLFSSPGKTFYFAMLFNVRTEELILTDVRTMSMKDSPSLLESNIYYTLFKVKHL
jgi:beta-barrel assembly-enhancing protease